MRNRDFFTPSTVFLIFIMAALMGHSFSSFGRVVRSGPWDLIDTRDLRIQGSTITKKTAGDIVVDSDGVDLTGGKLSMFTNDMVELNETEKNDSLAVFALGIGGLGAYSGPALVGDSTEVNALLGGAGGALSVQTSDESSEKTAALSVNTGAYTGSGADTTGTLSFFSGFITDAIATGITGGLNFFSGDNYGTNGSGVVAMRSGNTQAGESGDVFVNTGNSSAGPTGDLTVGSGNASGTSGDVVVLSGSGSQGGDVILKTDLATAEGGIVFQDGTQGNSGYVWQSIDSIGTGSWQPGNFANQTLSNLTSPTAINQSLLPNGTFNLGSQTNFWSNVWSQFFRTEKIFLYTNGIGQPADVAFGNQPAIPSGSATDVPGFFADDAGNSENIVFFTASNNNAVDTGTIYFETGNNTSTGDSGDLQFYTGTAPGGDRGKLKFKDGSEGNIGDIWTSVGVDGEGEWQPAPATGANTSLSNLTSPTSVNQDLVPVTAGSTFDDIATERTPNDNTLTIASQGDSHRITQSYTPIQTGILSEVDFAPYRSNANFGINFVVDVYLADVNGEPTGGVLATSDNLLIDGLPLSYTGFGIPFVFSGANKIQLNASTEYVFQIRPLNPVTNLFQVDVNLDDGIAGGRAKFFSTSGGWTGVAAQDSTTFKLTMENISSLDLGSVATPWTEVHAGSVNNSTELVLSSPNITFQDGSEGVSGECWVSKGVNGEGNWETCPGGGGGANTALSNLTSPTSINQDLIFQSGRDIANVTQVVIGTTVPDNPSAKLTIDGSNLFRFADVRANDLTGSAYFGFTQERGDGPGANDYQAYFGMDGNGLFGSGFLGEFFVGTASDRDVKVVRQNLEKARWTSTGLLNTGDLTLIDEGDATFPELRIENSDGSFYAGFRAGATATENTMYQLPNADGASGEVLSTDGAGVLSWTAAGGGDAWSDLVDSDIIPDGQVTRDLGSSGARFAEAYVNNIISGNNASVYMGGNSFINSFGQTIGFGLNSGLGVQLGINTSNVSNGNTGYISVTTGDNTTAGDTGDILLRSGDASNGANVSGDVILDTGDNPTVANKGLIKFDAKTRSSVTTESVTADNTTLTVESDIVKIDSDSFVATDRTIDLPAPIEEGQRLTLWLFAGNVELVNSATISLRGGGPVERSAAQSIEFIAFGSIWYEVSRSD